MQALDTHHDAPSSRWDWVDAAPFRAHARHMMECGGIPWRVLALYAQVPQPVMRALILGHGGRPLRRIAPAYARALLAVTPDRLRWSRCRGVDATHTASLCRRLATAGFEVRQVSAMIGAPQTQVRDLLENRADTVAELTEFCARAACLAHRLHEDDTSVLAVSELWPIDDPLAA